MNKKISIASLLVALGIVYGDIGTSPLYVVKSLIGVNNGLITTDIVYGGISLVFGLEHYKQLLSIYFLPCKQTTKVKVVYFHYILY